MSSEESSVEMCVLCCREIQIYAVGQCDHPVCHECSARMRVLCEQNECPICRGDMAYVLFTHKKQPFSSLHSFPLLDKRYMIAFEDKKAQAAFEELLKHSCESCGETFDTFKKLETHVRRQHNMQYCELCVESLKIFTFERKFYSRKDLAHHKRLGDLDDTSHRGHPMCEFCSLRFVDHDERFRHLRREHFFCHFCDVDGIHQYYSEYGYLRAHFREEHFLCEEGECAEQQQFISSAFRSKIDLQAHKAYKHSKNKTKAEAKQARTLDFEFSIAPRTMQNGERSPSSGEYRRGRYRAQMNQQRPQSAEESSNREPSDNAHDMKQQESKNFNACCDEEFPTLSGGRDGETGNSVWLRGGFQYGVPKQQRKAEDFPALAPLASSLKTSGAKTSHPKGAKSPWSDPQRLGKISRPGSAESSAKAKPRPWAAMKVTKSEEEFPRLETKKTFSSITEPTEQVHQDPEPLKQWPVSISSQTAEQLGQEIYSKCKSKKKKKKALASETDSTLMEDNQKPINPGDLSKAYSGISDRNANENEENLDPLQQAKVKCLNYEHPKKVKDDSDEVPWREKPNFVADVDFPPLEVSGNKSKGPPGFASPVISSLPVPPPGFSSKTQCKVKTCGSGISLRSVAQQLTSENVSGESALAQTKFSYEFPSHFQERNDVLTNMIYELLDTSNESFEKFRKLSGSFRKDKISAQEYHTQCVSMLGKDKVREIFTELVCLLPDISKQQELLSVHDKFLKDESKNRGAVPKHRLSNQCSETTVTSCPVCHQVLTNTDYPDHQKTHRNEIMR